MTENYFTTNRITKRSKSRNLWLCDFLYAEGPSETRFRKGLRYTKRRHLPQQNAALLLFDDGPRRKGKRSAAT